MKSELQRRFEKINDEPGDLDYAEAELHYTDFGSLDDFRAFCERHGLTYTAERTGAHYRHVWVAPDGCTLKTHRDPADPRDRDDPGYLSYTAVRGPPAGVEALLRDLLESCSYLKGAFSPLTTDSGDVLLSPYEYREEYREQQRADDDRDSVDVSALLGWLNPHQRQPAYRQVPVSIPGSDAETLRASEYDSIPELPAGAAYGSGLES
jgi:hypothetical protein